MKTHSFRENCILAIGVVATAIAWPLKAATEDRPASAAPVPPNSTTVRKLPDRIYLPLEFAHVLRLTKAGLNDDVIVAYVEASRAPHSVTTSQLITLHDVGVSQRVLKALVENSVPAEPRTPAALSGYSPPYHSSSSGAASGSNNADRHYDQLHYGWMSPASPRDADIGSFNANGLAPRLVSGQRTLMNQGPAFGVQGVPMVANNGSNPFLPFGQQPATGNLPPYGVYGVPMVQPVTGNAPPFGVPGVPIVPNNGSNPYLPFGQQPATGNLPPYGVYGAPMVQPVTGNTIPTKGWSSWPSAPRGVPYGGGPRAALGGGFHGGMGGVHGGGGGGHR